MLILVTRGHITRCHLPKTVTSTALNQGGKRLLLQVDVPRMSEEDNEKWNHLKVNRERGEKTDQQLWWDIASVSVGIGVPADLPPTGKQSGNGYIPFSDKDSL